MNSSTANKTVLLSLGIVCNVVTVGILNAIRALPLVTINTIKILMTAYSIDFPKN